jgi:hypothetical protein
MPGAVVVESGDQRMQAPAACATGDGRPASASAAVVHTPADVGTAVGAGVGATAASNPGMGSVRCEAGMGSRFQGVGYVDRRGLGTAVKRCLRR